MRNVCFDWAVKRLLRDKANRNLMESERSQENEVENTTVWIGWP
ncbi:hypothetical protein HMPREF9441_01650 [Paraprevotella clara YIT 11840]|uniref:Uncharacterized protein n=1 Tax=Paraprevotella clara YIT 11840 TaxID=762968 RepID=G5SQL0_9BACT|nr:hypothetical protein HMPREF9441_01650 [Paraprevotella clara YIT 11840]